MWRPQKLREPTEDVNRAGARYIAARYVPIRRFRVTISNWRYLLGRELAGRVVAITGASTHGIRPGDSQYAGDLPVSG